MLGEVGDFHKNHGRTFRKLKFDILHDKSIENFFHNNDLHSLLEDEFPKNDFENFLIHDKPLTDPNIVQTSQLSFGKNYGQS